ncbi:MULTISPECIES: Bug family tripartite tricarboxylate transporter substrate binding protein [Ramlibacter]|uniref:Tripartite tricarboxylate transporter substrate binding protein n=1 Tax=Ramlibacter pinisoli TaxID=2682844 RepID=A0A6N8IW18_9BURK|nr:MULTISPECIES: tripartite tricarboxylate transporter substrate binding protein [Ramlibacter]MBA2965346.1 tripartite tricarboxylate transporter substrate binding protein [Ramlibacter sp. CGMCC 1.13660]MVQ30310.1 tripartite tricarboxylate transporter substrate binding protein [Ramlibacter pinisoli]
MDRRSMILGAAAAGLGLPAARAQATFPTRAVTIVVPFGPGGPTDLVARLVAEKLATRWGQPVIVDNKPGAGGNVGSALVAKAAPDGHTLVLGVTGSHGINVSLFPALPYHPLRDFEPLTLATLFPNAIAVHPGVPAQNLRELLALARSKPGQLSYGSDGNGTASHLGVELIKTDADVFITHIPYRGGASMLGDLAGRQIDAGITGLPAALPLARAGKIRILAVTTAERTPAAPELPTVAEQGFPGYAAAPWAGFFAPKGVPPAVLARLSDDLVWALTQPDVRQRMAEGGSTIVASKPEEFRRFLQAEIARWARAVQASGAKID